MKKLLFICLVLFAAIEGHSQSTYYWVGGTTPTTSITIAANWNTSLTGSGSTRSSSTNALDVLIFDGSNVGGTTPPTTGTVNALANGSITCAQIKFQNNANVTFVRQTTGTSTVTISGAIGDDFQIDAGSSFAITSTVGSIRMAMLAGTTGKVSGNMSMITTLQARFDNTTMGTPNSFIFTSGSNFYTNITAASSSYAFGGNTQSSEKWVSFEDGSNLYYDGGFSPVGNVSTFSAIDFKPNSTFHIRVSNPTTGFGSFINRKNLGNLVVENGATLTADGPVNRINNLTVSAASSFITHTSGQTPVTGNVVVNGSISTPAASTNELLLGGTTQSVSGTGTISVGSLIIGAGTNVTLSKSVAVDQATTIYGKVNFGINQLTGNSTFLAEGIVPAATGTGNATSGAYVITGNAGITNAMRGQMISGAGVPANTTILGFSVTLDTIYVSNALTATATGVVLSITTPGATLQTANTNGFGASGTVNTAGNKTYHDNINYIIDGATTTPFGISTGSTNPPLNAGFVDINAPVTVNATVNVTNHIGVNAKITLRPLDTVHIRSGAAITGTFSSTKYIATVPNTSTGAQSIVLYDNLSSATTIPVGSATNYLPVVITPASASTFTVAVFEGITTNGTVNGTPLTPVQKQTVVDAVWNVNRLSGTGTASLQLGWQAGLEGSTFATLANTDIGIIYNTGSSYTLPIGTGDNTTNTAVATISNFGAYAIGAVPLTQPFIFNSLPVKTYGDADFNGGATSLNTTQPIVYTSSNPAVATIVGGSSIHITGAGTSDITASQASDGFYPSASVTRTLTVNKATLTITANNQTKFVGQAIPTLTFTYSAFAYSETPAVLTTPVVISTTATAASPAGPYPITVSGATAANYNITFVNGTLTIIPQQSQTITFAAPATKTYGNADFAIGATSTNTTIPLTYTSSNTAVATITGGNIHIVGAGTSNITVSQAGNVGYTPAADVVRTLTVNKAPLAIKVLDTVKTQGTVNPPFIVTYTGFVPGETAANLTSPATVTTTATTTSSPGYYALTLQGAASNNYNITYTNGRLTIFPLTGTGIQYFNPYVSSSSTLTVRVYSPLPKLGDVTIYNMAGQPLERKNLFMPTGFTSTNMYIGHLPSGIYVVTIRGAGVELTKQIAIVK